ncbi:hypothetical protein AGR7B_Cc50070 [Agrobacterium deltaense RV3]|nr:hypothetical protein AGR7B_Cc50070 [Agrobacterium deltaense RV3]
MHPDDWFHTQTDRQKFARGVNCGFLHYALEGIPGEWAFASSEAAGLTCSASGGFL